MKLPEAWSPETPSEELNEERYEDFKKRYRYDPVGFCRDCIEWPDGGGLAAYQNDILSKLVEHKRVVARGPHGLGKTAVAALAIIWFMLTRDGEDWKIPTTASVWRQLTKFLWPEIRRKWLRRVRWDIVGRPPLKDKQEIFTIHIAMQTGEAFAMASDDSETLEGAHADKVLFIFDEAKIIEDATWDSAEGAFSTGECYWLAISTPGEPVGRFYDINTYKPGYEDWFVRHVTLREAIIAGRISEDWADGRLKQWGKNDQRYQNRVLGEFAASSSGSLISLAWVEMANERWYDWKERISDGGYLQPVNRIGLDIARGGEDMTIFALRRGYVIDSLVKRNHGDTMDIVADGSKMLIDNADAGMCVEVANMPGVFDRLRELFSEKRIFSFNPSKGSEATDKSGEWGFVDTRSAAWWHMRELLDPSNNFPVALPPDDNLTGDLIAPNWKPQGEKIRVQSKEDIKKMPGRSHKSTDEGDAVVISFYEEAFEEEGLDYA